VALALMILVAMVFTFALVYRTTDSQLHAQIDRSISTEANELALAVTEHPGSSARAALATARRYEASQPYSNSNELLFVIVPGIGTASNHPELFGGGSRDDDGESAAVQAIENAQGRRLSVPHLGFNTLPAPDAGVLRLYEVRVEIHGTAVYAGAGEGLGAVSHAADVVSHSFLLAGACVLVLGVLAAYGLGTRITAPIRRSAAVATRIDGGDLTPRIELPIGSSTEVQALADAMNHMLDRLAVAFQAQREFVADASHELRTPLTVLRGQLDLMGSSTDQDDPRSHAELARVKRMMQSEVARLTRLVEDLLLLAQADRADFLHPSDVRLDELATELWDGLSLTAARNFELGVLKPVTIRGDPDRLAQALRNLARNAINHTRAPNGLVRIDVARARAGAVTITVTDDGPGVDPAVRKRVFERFYRTDAARTRAAGGAGLGLAIVSAIAEAHEGSVHITTAETGGAAFKLELPDGLTPAVP